MRPLRIPPRTAFPRHGRGASARSRLAAAGLALGFVASCGEAVNIDKVACERLQAEDSTSLVAAVDLTLAPTARSGHRRYDVTLTDIGGAKGGFLTFAPTESADYAFFLDQDVALRLLADGGRELQPEMMGRAGRCPEVKGRLIVNVPKGAHALAFGPTNQDKVGLVIEEDPRGHEHGH